ncbi:MAG: DUF3854 domain-containing protein [Candidatus Acidiferrales bacterium]
MLEVAGIQSVTDAEAREILGLHGHHGSDLGGILIPYRHPLAGGRVGARIRLDHALPDGGKYISEPGCRQLFFPPFPKEWLTNTSINVVFVESEKAALALLALANRSGRELISVALGGCWGWLRTTGNQSLPDGGHELVTGPSPSLELIIFQDRIVVIVFDSNAATNPKVRKARLRFAQELAWRGSQIWIGQVPDEPGINGPDDLIAFSGDEAALGILDAARLFALCAIAEAEQAIAAIEADKKSDPIPVIESIAAIESSERRALLSGQLVALRVAGLTRKFVEQQVRNHRFEDEADRVKAAEASKRGRLLAMNVKGADLIVELENYFSERAWQSKHTALVEALFTMLTYCSEQFSTVPYLCFESATPGCGKSTCLDLFKAVVARPLYSAGLSRAVLVRQLDERRVTLLLDESEWLSSHSETSEAIRGILHAGYRRGATYQLCEGDDHEMRDFQVYGPKVFSAIHGLRGALLDRCIVIHMERLPENKTLLPAGADDLEPVAAPCRERLEAYALQIIQRLEELKRRRPTGGYWPEFRNREAELWHPLLTIARACGPEIELRALQAARAMSRAKQVIQADERQIAQGRELIEVLRGMSCQLFRPAELVGPLEESETWAEVLWEKKDARIKAAIIGRYISRFRICSRGRSRTGSFYDRLNTIDVISQHMPRILLETPPNKSATSVTPAKDPATSEGYGVTDRLTGLQPKVPQASFSVATTADGLAHCGSGVNQKTTGEYASCDTVTDVADNSGTEEDL